LHGTKPLHELDRLVEVVTRDLLSGEAALHGVDRQVVSALSAVSHPTTTTNPPALQSYEGFDPAHWKSAMYWSLHLPARIVSHPLTHSDCDGGPEGH
jgi:hypothetical protein